jgi:hypothetical protein
MQQSVMLSCLWFNSSSNLATGSVWSQGPQRGARPLAFVYSFSLCVQTLLGNQASAQAHGQGSCSSWQRAKWPPEVGNPGPEPIQFLEET